MMKELQQKKLVLIENGILKNFMQDRLNARLMKTRSTVVVEEKIIDI